MKRLILTLIMLSLCTRAYAGSITVDPFVTPDDVTIAHLENFRTVVVDAINSADGGLLQDGTVTTIKLSSNANPENRWNEAFNDFVFTGLLPPTTSSTLVSTTTAGTAYVDGVRVVKDATAKTYTATKWTYVDLSSNGTYTYQETTIEAAAPATTANSIRLARVSTDATEVTNVRDDRITSVQVAQNEDFYLEGLELALTTPDTVIVTPGVVYNGITRVSKTANLTLVKTTATDWHDGVVDSYAAQGWLYVGAKNNGDIKFLGDNPPDKADTSGNTVGTLRYWYDGTNYWRVIGVVHVATSDDLDRAFRQEGDWIYYDTMQTALVTGTATSWLDVNASTYVPDIARSILFAFDLPTSGAAGALHLRTNGSDSAGIVMTVNSGSGAGGATGQGTVYSDSSQIFEFQISGSASSANVSVTGFYIGDLR